MKFVFVKGLIRSTARLKRVSLMPLTAPSATFRKSRQKPLR